MPFKAGQFVMLQVPVEGQTKPVQRAYSIASTSKRDDKFTLLFKHVPGGIASEYVKALKGGETLQFTGPWGKCLFKHPAAKQVLFICTGTGLSQHYCFLTSEVEKYPDTQFHMLIGVGSESEMYYDEKLQAATQEFKNFQYRWCLSRPSPAWTKPKGRVTAFLGEYDLSIPTHVYLCGSDAMIKEVKATMIEKYNVAKENLIIENFG
jgi:NAD(P)H-flavin reductase